MTSRPAPQTGGDAGSRCWWRRPSVMQSKKEVHTPQGVNCRGGPATLPTSLGLAGKNPPRDPAMFKGLPDTLSSAGCGPPAAGHQACRG